MLTVKAITAITIEVTMELFVIQLVAIGVLLVSHMSQDLL
jgi:hypothetical protein